MTVKLSAIQMCSVPDIDKNIASISQQLSLLPQSEQHVVLLPECCLFFGGKDKQQLAIAKHSHSADKMINELAALAREFNVYLIAGSIPIAHALHAGKFANTCLVFDPSGNLVSQYEKLHLFDVEVQDKEQTYAESRFTESGNHVEVYQLPFANLGLSICYDLRFPELYRQLRTKGADIVVVPAAFTRVTGKAHWQALLQARAIENQVYIIAAGQEGVHENGRETWGHSMIISPWGEVLAHMSTGIGSVSADYEPRLIAKIRNNIPVEQHNRFKTELIHDE